MNVREKLIKNSKKFTMAIFSNMKSIFEKSMAKQLLVCAYASVFLGVPAARYSADTVELCYDPEQFTFQMGALSICKALGGSIISKRPAEFAKEVLQDSSQGIFICDWKAPKFHAYFFYQSTVMLEYAKDHCKDVGGKWYYSKKIPED